MSPAMAFPVYTGSRTSPSVRAASAIASMALRCVLSVTGAELVLDQSGQPSGAGRPARRPWPLRSRHAPVKTLPGADANPEDPVVPAETGRESRLSPGASRGEHDKRRTGYLLIDLVRGIE